MDDVEKPKTVWHDVRKVCHDEAAEIASRLIAGAFGRDDKKPNFSIPCRPDYDDDCLILAYIEQQKAAAIAAMEPQWLPIDENTPANTKIFLWCPDHMRGAPVGTVFGRVAKHQGLPVQAYGDGMNGDWTYTHWRPNFAPPTAAGSEG